jgi:hypothetical protein
LRRERVRGARWTEAGAGKGSAWVEEVSRGLTDRFVEAKAQKWRRRGLSACAVSEEVCLLIHGVVRSCVCGFLWWESCGRRGLEVRSVQSEAALR